MVVAGLLLLPAARAGAAADPRARSNLVAYAAQSGAGAWAKATARKPELSAREIYLYALALCEADLSRERLAPLFEAGAQMQDRDPASRDYGNFRWYWRETAVDDRNAVEFCMQAATLIWLRHRDRLPPDARAVLARTLELAAEGCRRHRVSPSYTNIALMNAANLVLLGEGLGQDAVAAEGYRRLDGVCAAIATEGIHEYGSPTYYGVDLDDLVLLEAFCQRETGRAQAQALLALFWSDVALNYWQPSQRLAGTHSRDYDYLRGFGALDTHLWYQGWLDGPSRGGAAVLFPLLGRWRPGADILARRDAPFPRTLRQSWGGNPHQVRMHAMHAGVTLSTSGEGYGAMDLPLTVDLPGDRTYPRGYFIPDGRHDPYGQVKIQEKAHRKTLHLRPFWCGTQCGDDALGLVLYRAADVPAGTQTLESHFVLPRDVDGFWIGGRPVVPDAAGSALPPGRALVLRRGRAVVGLRVPWARAVDGTAAAVTLVDDGNRHGVVRLTVTHHVAAGARPVSALPGAAFWVRVGDGVADDAAAVRWGEAFAAAEARVQAAPDSLAIGGSGGAGSIALAVQLPACAVTRVEPPRGPAAVLEVNGVDLGRRLLQHLPCLRTLTPQPPLAALTPVAVTTQALWEAEAGSLCGAMQTAPDGAAAGERMVWTPGEAGSGGGPRGTVAWVLDCERAGDYRLWGRVRAATPENDSFVARLTDMAGAQLWACDWHIGSGPGWRWVPLDRQPRPWPAGRSVLELRTREAGAAIDRLLLTTNPKPLAISP